MNAAGEIPELPFARPLDGSRPQRREIVLSDGYRTSAYVHAQAHAVKNAPVVYLHGIQSHPGWFVGSAASMGKGGWEVWQVTRRGSGLNRRDRGDAPSAGQLLADVETACRAAEREGDADRVHLVGVSWGGKLAGCYAGWADRTVKLASLTLIAPGIVPRVDVAGLTKLAIGLSLLVCPRRRFDIPLSNVELFTDNPSMREYLRRDSCRLHRATARFLRISRSLDGMLRRSPVRPDFPVTLILAGRDRIIDNARTQESTARLAGEHLEVRQLEGAHTLDFEPDPQPLYQALADALARGEPPAR